MDWCIHSCLADEKIVVNDRDMIFCKLNIYR